MFNFFCKILQHPKINPGSAHDDNQNESVASMPQNAVSTRDESEHLLSQNEVLAEETV